ncbi:MAG: hypothetical protein AB4372_19075 [Xenococcus sp. (in: cyanobacteria)]
MSEHNENSKGWIGIVSIIATILTATGAILAAVVDLDARFSGQTLEKVGSETEIIETEKIEDNPNQGSHRVIPQEVSQSFHNNSSSNNSSGNSNISNNSEGGYARSNAEGGNVINSGNNASNAQGGNAEVNLNLEPSEGECFNNGNLAIVNCNNSDNNQNSITINN